MSVEGGHFEHRMQPQGADRVLACSGRNSTVRMLLHQVRFEHRKMGKDFPPQPHPFCASKTWSRLLSR